MRNFWNRLGLGGKLAITYLIISLVGIILFFTGICTLLFFFGAGLCIAPAFPWPLIFLNTLYENLLVLFLSLIVGIIINSVILFIIGYVSEKIFKKYGIEKMIALILVALSIIVMYQWTLKEASDPSNCFYDQVNPDACFSEKAREKGDINLCANIKEGDMKAFCYGIFSAQQGNPVQCEGLSDDKARNICYSDIAYKLKNKSLCEKISDPLDEEGCRLRTISINTTPQECSAFSKESARDFCYNELARILKDSFLCANLSYSSRSTKGNCYYSIAINTNNYSLCEFANANSIPDKNLCYSIIANNIQDDKVCELIKGDDRQWNNCFYSIATGSDRLEICEKLTTVDAKQNCHESIKLKQLMEDDY